MKTNSLFIKLSYLAIFVCGLFICACRKNVDTVPEEPNSPDDKDKIANADTISNRLTFLNATKSTGTMPKGQAGGSLKISFKDTIYLVDALIPIKFLHEDTTKNVAGAMVQIYSGGTSSIFYFDVHEHPDAAENDTVSTIMIGINSEGLLEDGVPPAGGAPFEIKIVPYDKNGEALAEITRPLEISSPGPGNGGGCGLVGGSFFWEVSYNMQGFYNSPEKLWGLAGQNIQGCCTNGESGYTANCKPENKRRLNFRTFFGWPRERWFFLADGNYAGVTDYLSASPAPDESDFCGDGQGVVHEKFKVSFPEGKWSVNASNQLITVGVIAANSVAQPTGKIFSLRCRYLIVVHQSLETGDEASAVYHFYMRNYPGQPRWHNL